MKPFFLLSFNALTTNQTTWISQSVAEAVDVRKEKKTRGNERLKA